jgi:hypothetical protein
MSFATERFGDMVSSHNMGLPPGVYATGSTAGSVIQYINFRRLTMGLFLGSTGSGNATAQLLFQIAPASTGTFSTVASTVLLTGSTTSVTGPVAWIDTRGEAVYGGGGSYGPQGLSASAAGVGGQSMTTPAWCRCVLSVANSSVTCGIVALGYLEPYEGRGFDDSSSYVAGYSDFI